MTPWEEHAIWTETAIFEDFFRGVDIDDEKKLGLAEKYARMVAEEPLRLKALAAYYLENTTHDRGVAGGILDRAVGQAIDMLMPYMRASQPQWARVILDGESVTDHS